MKRDNERKWQSNQTKERIHTGTHIFALCTYYWPQTTTATQQNKTRNTASLTIDLVYYCLYGWIVFRASPMFTVNLKTIFEYVENFIVWTNQVKNIQQFKWFDLLAPSQLHESVFITSPVFHMVHTRLILYLNQLIIPNSYFRWETSMQHS